MRVIVRLMKILELTAFFLKEVVVANLQVAKLVFQKSESIHPSFIRVPLDVKTDRGIYLLSSMITLTPGTLSLEVSRDRKFLYVHVIHTLDPDSVVQDIKKGFERRLLEVGC